MSALWSALDDIDGYYGSVPDDDDDGDVRIPAATTSQPRPARHIPAAPPALLPNIRPAVTIPDADDRPILYPTDKAREALHPCPIRAHERQMALVANGDPQAVAIARACAIWLAARAAAEEVK